MVKEYEYMNNIYLSMNEILLHKEKSKHETQSHNFIKYIPMKVTPNIFIMKRNNI